MPNDKKFKTKTLWVDCNHPWRGFIIWCVVAWVIAGILFGYFGWLRTQYPEASFDFGDGDPESPEEAGQQIEESIEQAIPAYIVFYVWWGLIYIYLPITVAITIGWAIKAGMSHGMCKK